MHTLDRSMHRTVPTLKKPDTILELTPPARSGDAVIELELGSHDTLLLPRRNRPGSIKKIELIDDGANARTRYTLFCPCGMETYANVRPRKCPGCHRPVSS